MSKISPHAGSISTIVRSYKSAVTRFAHFKNLEFEWQERFYDHIIRDAESFGRIEDYIENNPKNWRKDTFYQ
jgi:REP element-mobilizing transposase RayT